MKQDQAIKHISDKQLNQSLILSQLLLLLVSIIASLFLFESISDWFRYFDFHFGQVIYYGFLPACIIILIDLILIYFLPKRYLDDGGINKRIFKNRSLSSTLVICLLIAVAEEMLFRGILQTTFGYITASIIFAFVHIRYLAKPVLFISVLFSSFYIGYLFLITENLIVTIVTHFIVNFSLGRIIRYQK